MTDKEFEECFEREIMRYMLNKEDTLSIPWDFPLSSQGFSDRALDRIKSLGYELDGGHHEYLFFRKKEQAPNPS